MKQKTVTSVSSGRTSSYMALHYPTDYNIFSLVRIEDRDCAPKDKKLIQYVEDKIKMPFIATAESDFSLYVMVQLEQDLGKEITWVTGDTFEQVIFNSWHNGALPNRRMRFCTTQLKIEPIFWWCYMNLFEDEDDYILMNIGYRADEPRRGFNNEFKFNFSCNNFGEKRNNWKEIEWRSCNAPLRTYGIDQFTVRKFFNERPQYVFPEESNCVHCFNKTEAILHKQFENEPKKMNWAKNLEKLTGNRFNISKTLYEIEQMDFKDHIEQDCLLVCNCTD